jgi:hypothetical protein
MVAMLNFFSNDQGQELDINLMNCYYDLAQWKLSMFGKHFIIFCCFERIESNLSHLVTFWQDLRLPSYWITTDSPRCLNLSLRYSAFVQYCMSWFDCLIFLRGLCCAVELLTPHRTEHRSKLLLDHASQPLTSTGVRSIAQSPLLRLHFFSPRSTRRMHRWQM